MGSLKAWEEVRRARNESKVRPLTLDIRQLTAALGMSYNGAAHYV